MEQQSKITIDDLAAMMANGFAEVRDQFATLETHVGDLDTRVRNLDAHVIDVEVGLNRRIDNLSYKVDQLDAKLEVHSQETKDGLAAMRTLMGGMSHTLVDHEERIKELEGE